MRRPTWFDTIDGGTRSELLAMREDFRAGEYGGVKPLTVARAIKEEFASRGVVLCDIKRLGEWLKSKA